jgi:SPP1 gp7 family putative phage head morphogenesis protein
MPTVNETLLDSSIQHSIDSIRYSNGVVRRMLALLNRVDPDLNAKLTAALERLPPESFTVERLDALLASVMSLNKEVYNALQTAMEGELKELVSYEAEYQKKLFETVIPVKLSIAPVNVEAVYAAALSRPFSISKDGAVPMGEYLKGLEADRADKIRDAIRLGYVEGETIDQITRRIRGTRTNNYADGLLEAPRRYVEGMVRTSINHVSNFTRQRFYEANDDVVKGVMWVSTLDGHTSQICRIRDLKVFPVNSGPRPPAHINCRSSTTPVLKSWRELGIDIEDEAPSSRAAMSGQVPEGMNYQQWLQKQSAAVQDDVLGESRGKLFRNGMKIDRFSDNKGKLYTLDQLRQKNKELFSKSGV